MDRRRGIFSHSRARRHGFGRCENDGGDWRISRAEAHDDDRPAGIASRQPDWYRFDFSFEKRARLRIALRYIPWGGSPSGGFLWNARTSLVRVPSGGEVIREL